MRSLLPVASDNVDLHAWYARDWLDRGGLRLNFVASVDGAATDDGLSAGLQTRGDNAVFAALRDLADVILAGAGTIRVESYSAIDLSPQRRATRVDLGLAPVPPIAIVSRSLRLDPAAPLFTAAPDAARTIVITGTAGDPTALADLQQVADVIVLGTEDVDLAAAKAALAERGLRRILCEGGPTLFGALARVRAVDELCLSITPLLTGPGARRIVAGEVWDAPPCRLTLDSLLEEDGALFCRYLVV